VTAPDQPFRAPTGTRDILPPESARWETLIGSFAAQVEAAGYGLIQSPLFEEIGVFQRMGEGTDVVRKEMYDFHDKGDRHLALRPEGTASVVRAFVQHRPVTPWKTWYVAPSFRYERPQAGRFRQHHQLGIEAIGVADPDVDVETIGLLWRFFESLGLRQLTLHLNSMGDLTGRPAYLDDLRTFLRGVADDLSADDQDKIADRPMRVLDSKRPETQAATADAPTLLESLTDEATEHFARVQEGLAALDIPFAIDHRLVRGLDYYTHTTFEVKAPVLDAAQNTIGGGGRYDGLAESLGGPPTPAIGFGSGIERILLACDAEDCLPGPDRSVDVFVVDVAGGADARDLTFELRAAGISADRAFEGRSMKSQMKSADRSGARLALIVGDDERERRTVTARPLRHDAEQESIERDQTVERVRKLLS
jgi:histidyl-tRNA synthetase